MADYSIVSMQADKLDVLSNDLEAKISSLEALRVRIKGEWCGPVSEEYQNQLSRLIADMIATRQGLNEAASTIREMVIAQNKMS